MAALPAPVRGGSLAELRRLLNLRDDRDWVLVVAWLLAALRDRGPYPVLVLVGEQGAGKTLVMALLRRLVDPNAVPLRSKPRDERDLFIAATNGHVIALDNVSSLPPWLSDALCRLATGGGFATRQLYSDGEETLLEAMRPIATTGIDDYVTRGDLADRAIVVRLDPILEDHRRTEQEILAEFEAARPKIFGALLDAVAHGLRALPTTRLDRLPRMADFAVWATACEGALWPAGTFAGAYTGARAEMDEMVIESDVVAVVVRSFAPAEPEWTGTAAELLPLLTSLAGEAVATARSWPQTPRALSGRLRRAAPALRRIGIGIEFERAHAGRRITISAVRPKPPASGRHNRHNRHWPQKSWALSVTVGAIPPTRTVTRPSPPTRGNPRSVTVVTVVPVCCPPALTAPKIVPR
jgi:hypothetical protein